MARENRGVMKNNLFFISDRILCGNVCHGGRAGSEQAVGSVFQFVTDRMDYYYRNYYDRDGVR